jgi:hypothetical protein
MGATLKIMGPTTRVTEPYIDGMSAIVNFVPCCMFLSAKLCTVAAKLPGPGRCPSRLCSSDMISAANSAKAGHHDMEVDAEPSFSFLLLRYFWGEERFLKPLDEPFVTGSRSRRSTTDCASAESEPGGGRYPSAFCSSDWSLRTSSAVRVLTLISLSALVVKEVTKARDGSDPGGVRVRVRNDRNEKGPYLIFSASALAASLNVALSSPRLESGCFADDRCALAARESGGGRYPRFLCSSDMMIRASLTPTLSRSMLRVVIWMRFASSRAATLRILESMVPAVVLMSVISSGSAGLSAAATTAKASMGGM